MPRGNDGAGFWSSFRSGIAPLVALSVVTAWGLDARAAIACGAVGMLGAAALSLRLPEPRDESLSGVALAAGPEVPVAPSDGL